jgi:hypothetical protein
MEPPQPPPNPAWQVFNIGIGIFAIGVVVRIMSKVFVPSMDITAGQVVPSGNQATFEMAVEISRWVMGLGALVVAVAASAIALRSTAR